MTNTRRDRIARGTTCLAAATFCVAIGGSLYETLAVKPWLALWDVGRQPFSGHWLGFRPSRFWYLVTPAYAVTAVIAAVTGWSTPSLPRKWLVVAAACGVMAMAATRGPVVLDLVGEGNYNSIMAEIKAQSDQSSALGLVRLSLLLVGAFSSLRALSKPLDDG